MAVGVPSSSVKQQGGRVEQECMQKRQHKCKCKSRLGGAGLYLLKSIVKCKKKRQLKCKCK